MNQEEADPTKLIQAAKEGDQEAFSKLYELYYVPIYKYIYFRVKDEQDTEDITQTVFLKVYKSIDRFENRGKSPLAYFFTVARNTVIDYTKKKKKDFIAQDPLEKIEYSLQDERPSPSELLEQKFTSKMVQNAIATLSPDQQETIVLRYINDFSNKEIASILKKSENAVRQLQFQALKNITNIF